MTAGFVRREPTNHKKMFRNPEVVDIFQKLGWINYFQKLDGFDEEVAMEFATNLKKDNEKKSITEVRVLKITLTKEYLSLLIRIPKGRRWDNDNRESTGRDKKTFFRLYEPIRKIKIDTLLEPWDEVAYFVLKYLTCEERLSVPCISFQVSPLVKEPFLS